MNTQGETGGNTITARNPRIVARRFGGDINGGTPGKNHSRFESQPVAEKGSAEKIIDLQAELVRRGVDINDANHSRRIFASDLVPTSPRALWDLARLLAFPMGAATILIVGFSLFGGRSRQPDELLADYTEPLVIEDSAEDEQADAELEKELLAMFSDTSRIREESEREIAQQEPEEPSLFGAIANRLTSLGDGLTGSEEPETGATNPSSSAALGSASPSSASYLSSPGGAEEMRSKVKFIAGLIAMHRPSIQNCGEVARAIVEIASKERLDPFFIAAVISIESRFANNAVSPVGARGLMQLMPATARSLKRLPEGHALQHHLADTKTNIELGVKYLRTLQAKYRGDRRLALAAYNWGPGKVDRAVKNRSGVPSSVAKYAATILERSKSWSAHYQKAKISADNAFRS